MTKRWVLAVLGCVLLVTSGCANVPKETKPQVIGSADTANTGDALEDIRPAQDLSPYDTVRKFVLSAQAATDYKEARLYLAKNVADDWQPSSSLVILRDQFSTLPVDAERQPEDPDETIIRLRGRKIGALGSDNAFIPGGGTYEIEISLRRTPGNRQWRIVDPPAEMITTESQFVENYYQLPLYFFAPDSAVRVPDPRYVLAQPREGLPGRIVDTLLQGPSDALATAVRNPLEKASLDTNVTVNEDGALEVPLTGVAGESAATRRLMAFQLVMSLDAVATNRIRLLSDGQDLVPGRRDWRITDVPPVHATVSANLSGLALSGNQVVRLDDSDPLAGPAGSGAYDVRSAAQSVDGGRLAVVENARKRVRLRVGPTEDVLSIVDLDAKRMTRPTWRPSSSDDNPSNEVWTVTDRKKVVRVTLTLDGTWQAQQVDDSALQGFGPITALRLSRDGTRAAIVADHKLIVASVVRTSDGVRLRAPRILQPETLTDVIDVDWQAQDALVVATESSISPVVRVPVDGFGMESYTTSNLEPPVSAVTGAPGRPVVAANDGGLWQTSDLAEVWRQSSRDQSLLSSPFYPG
ncbi:LpqB family beta-propeller domain-containing protein [Haloechinothrix salitolerans]|uniref:LpqB family beta-propeller domain-containing protein n=1 Tax=Haloechinothrix salitolerans TaxID=926830 RepID=A0ABW2BY36_9PSEU